MKTHRIINFLHLVFILIGFNLTSSGSVPESAMPLSARQIVLGTLCVGTIDGSIVDTITGGVPPYSMYAVKNDTGFFNGSIVDSIGRISGLDTGSYLVIITDNNKDSIATTAIITGPLPITATIWLSSDTVCGHGILAYCICSGGTPPLNISWLYNYELFSFADTVTIIQAGVISVYIIDSNGCSASIDTTLYACVTGIQQLGNEPFFISLYPNPTTSNFTIETNSTGPQQLQLFDLTGQLLLSQPIQNSKTTINASSLAAGVYLVNLKSSEGTFTQKVVITK